MPVPYSIHPVSESDLPTLGKFVHSSKLALTINRLLFQNWPNDAVQKPIYAQAVESGFKDPKSKCLKAIDDETGDIIGYLVLSEKRKADTKPPTNQKIESGGEHKISDGFEPDVYAAVSSAVEEIAKETDGIDHFELTYMCVKPSSRRRGIGSRLVQHCFDKAKSEGMPLAVCAEPAAHDFFLELGFRDTQHADIELRQWAPEYAGFGLFRLSGMIWHP